MYRRTSRPSAALALLAAVLAMVAGFPGLAAAAVSPQVFSFGTAADHGDLRTTNVNASVADLAATPTGNGYWEMGSDGGIFTFGDATYYGSTGSFILNQPLVAMAPTKSGHGYYLLAKDGGVFTFGDGSFFGSAGGVAPSREWVDMAIDPDGAGYWFVAADGTVFNSSSAVSFGNGPVPAPGIKAVGIAVSGPITADGLWIAYSDGTVAPLGAATDLGSSTAFGTTPVVDVAANAARTGLWLLGSTGQVEALGTATPSDDAPVARPAVAIAAHTGDGYWVASQGPNLGSISGRVLDDAANPIPDLCVSTAGPSSVTTRTDVNGNYALTGLRAGQYRVRLATCADQPYLTEYYKDAGTFSSATVVTVGIGEDVVLDDATVTRGATLSGVVRNVDGDLLADACVGAYDRGVIVGSNGLARTSVTGYYKLQPLPAADYFVNFSDCTNHDYVGEWYDDVATAALSTPIGLALGEDKTADAVLARAGSISGAVATDDAGVLPGNVCVAAYADGVAVSKAPVQTGAYKIKGLAPGSYQVHFNDCVTANSRNDYVDEWWNDKPARETSQPVDVTTGTDSPNVDASLARGATISGGVTTTSGAAVTFACVDAIQSSVVVARTFSSGPTGAYTLRGLAPGSYSVRFSQCDISGNLAREYWSDSPSGPGTAVDLAPAENRTGISAVLGAAGKLQGTVTNGSGTPVRACVSAYDEVGQIAVTTASVTGFYQLTGLNSAPYKLKFSDCTNPNPHLATEWFQDSATKEGAAPVTATAGANVDVPTVVLDEEGVISGVVTDARGRTLADMCVRPIQPDGEDATFSTVQTTVTGFYRIPRLAAGSYQVRFDDCQSFGFVGEWWNDAPTRAEATPVTVTSGGTTSSIDAELTIKTADPAAVSGVLASASHQAAHVTWTLPAPDPSILGYRVVASPGGAAVDVGTSATAGDFSGLTNGQSYTFRVKTRTAYGTNAGVQSNAVTPTGTPGAPGKPTVTFGDGSASVSWTAADTGGSALTGYTVTASPGGAASSVDGSTLSTTINGLTNGTAYTFTAVASNAFGAGPASAASDAVTPAGAPGTPGKPSVTRGDGSVALAWSAADGNGRPVTQYTITASPGGATMTSATTTATFLGLTNGTPYTFTVKATNAVGDGSPSAASDAVAPAGLPGAPGKPSVTRGDASVALTWTASDPNGAALTQYVITASPGGATKTVAGNLTAATFTGLTNGTSYTFAVKATNGVGDGAASPASDAVTPAGVPGAPGKPSATRGDGSVALAWTAANANGSPLTQYIVTASPGGASFMVPGNITSMNFTGLSNGTAYTFTVRASNAVGDGSPSVPSDAVTAAGLPGAPGKPSATPHDHSVALTWAAAGTNGSPLTQYAITASPGGGTLTVPGNVTSINFPGLTNGTSYTFTVKATNAVGEGAASPASDPVTPSGLPGAPGLPVAVAGNASVTLTWAPAGANGSAVTQYTVTASPGGATVSVGGTLTGGTFGGLTNGTTYTFTVRATNGAGTGPASAASLPVTPAAPPVDVPVVGVGTDADKSVPTDGDFLATGDGYAPFSTGTIVINSTPRLLGTFVADANGHFAVLVKIPADLEPGVHTVVSTGTAPGGASFQQASPVVVVAGAPAGGYRLLGADGGVFSFGDAGFLGSTGDARRTMAGGVSTPSGKGYWVATLEGIVFAFGDAAPHGSLAGTTLNKPIVGMASTPSGNGYWLVASDGGIFSFGDAGFFGSTGAMVLNKPIVGMASTATGKGYWLVASDGGIFSFGDAAFFGSTGAMVLNKPIVGMATSPSGRGYRLVASDGGIFTFGDAGFFGSTGGTVLNKPIVGMLGSPSGKGYRLVASDGGVFAFGDATYLGSTGDIKLNKPVIALF
jgi:hypothetical protein